jgi:hypothetical protein
MVPVTTKPYFNSISISIPQQASLRFFSFIKNKISQRGFFCKNAVHELEPYRSYLPLCGTFLSASYKAQFRLRLKLRFTCFQQMSFVRLTNITALRLEYFSLINKGGFS